MQTLHSPPGVLGGDVFGLGGRLSPFHVGTADGLVDDGVRGDVGSADGMIVGLAGTGTVVGVVAGGVPSGPPGWVMPASEGETAQRARTPASTPATTGSSGLGTRRDITSLSAG